MLLSQYNDIESEKPMKNIPQKCFHFIMPTQILQQSKQNIKHIIHLSMIRKAKLSVSVHDVEFAKDFQYCISVHYDGVKKQTDTSALARNPIFTQNTFFFDLPSNHVLRGGIVFIAHLVMEDDQPQHIKRQTNKKSKILGECSLDLTPFGLQPTETYNLPIRQQLKFFRVKEGKQISVGRFIASFKIVPEEDVPVFLEQVEEKKLEKNQIYVDLPDYEEQLSFSWRVKLDIREALNIPEIDNMTPQVYMEVGWTEYRDTLPEQKRIFSTMILNTNHPEWNQIFLITNPAHITSEKGFIMIALKQKNMLDDLIRLYLPVQSMGPFVPYNLKVVEKKELATSVQLYISAILESSKAQKDKLYDIIVADIIFDPLVLPYKQINLALMMNSEDEPSLNFLEFNPAVDSIERLLEFDERSESLFILTQTMKVPPIKSVKQFRAACIITIPDSFLKKELYLYVIGKSEKGKYQTIGLVESIQKDLVSMLVEKIKKKLFFTVRPHPNIKMGRCQIQIADKEDVKVGSQLRISSRQGEETASEKLMKDLNISSNDSLFKHITQNNEIIARILRQLDHKSESLRQAGSEISDLRNRVKLLQNQNSILRKKALQEEDELAKLVQRQIDGMSQRELKDKIIKISQLYKAERVQNKELEKAIKVMEPQVSNVMQLNSVIANHKNTIHMLEEKIEKFKKDQERIGIYKETIKKQQKVILKLEKVMNDGMDQVRNARQIRLELEQLKKKGGNQYHSKGNSAQKQEIERLQRIIADLQRNAKLKNSTVSDSPNSFQLEFKLHQAETRVQSLEEQLEQRSKQYARQVAMYKLKIAEKDAILDGFSNTRSYN